MKKLATILCGAILLCTPLSLRWTENEGVSVSVSEANARIGRPLTPLSVAGVHRRAHRRAYYGGGYYGGAGYYGGYYGGGRYYRGARYYGGPRYYAHRRYYHGRYYR